MCHSVGWSQTAKRKGNTMWLFTQYGFFSVVCARDLTGKMKGIDPNTFMVRARSR